MTSQFLAAAATIGLLGAGFAHAGETRAFEAMTGQTTMFGSGEGSGAGDKCRVDVIRTGSPGTAAVTRQDFSDGSCVCTVTTGPAANNGSAESVVAGVVRERECAGANGNAVDPAEASGGGMGGGAMVGVLFGLAAIGVGVGAGGGGDSAG